MRSPRGAASILVGSYHIGISFEQALPGLGPALDVARVVVLEVDADPATLADDPAFLALALLPDGEDLRRILPPELWPKLRERFAGVDDDALARLAPWVLASMLMVSDATGGAVAPAGDASDAEAPAMLDEEVRARATARATPIRALETLAEQVDLLRSIPVASYVAYLRSALLAAGDSRRALGDTMDAYIRGDTVVLEERARAELVPELHDAMVVDRNLAWLDRLVAELEPGGAFVVVGLLHVVGERGLLALLGERGYEVERLTSDE